MRRLQWLILSYTTAWILLSSCEPEPEHYFEVFIIPKGEHYCKNRRPETLQTDVLQFRAYFDSSAIYLFDDNGLQDSKNKLMGFSDCNVDHHENSARFAWQWFDNKLEIYAYCYVNGQRVEKFLGVTELNTADIYTLTLTDKSYIFSFKDNQVTIPRGTACQEGIYMMLWPYFGGTLPAPHDVSIFIDRF